MTVETSPVPVTPALGEWVSQLTVEAIPEAVRTHVKLCILDSIGCGIFGAAQPWGRIAGDVVANFSGGSGASSLLGRREKVSPPDAALANGTAIHGFEIDDAHVSSSLHPGAVTVPAVFAVAEQRALSGGDVLAATVAGYEAGIRVGVCAGVSHSTSGYHVTGTAGALAAAAASARALRLTAKQSAHALGIGATQAAGLYSARTGAMAKRFHAGRAAQSGVVAAYLAESGFTGSLEAIEAPFGGFMSTLHGQSEAVTILAGIGERWETLRVGIKAYAACASAHTTIDGVRHLRARGLSAGNLARLTIRVSRKSHLNIGWPYKPGDTIAAQMNGSYAAAVALLDGEAFIDQYATDRLADPAILALLPHIEFVHDPEIDKGGAEKRHAVAIRALRKDGSELGANVEQRRGSADHPLTEDEIHKKFRRVTQDFLAPDSASEVIDLVGRLEQQHDLGRLMALIAKA